ncbi:zf-TFIIB domain-containing protein [Paenibacillus tarimensis]
MAMKCPICDDVRMREVEKDGVLIDVCPDCKGVWLDRGELDKLMRGVNEMRKELEHGSYSYAPPENYSSESRQYQDIREYEKHNDDRRYDKHKPYGYGYDKKGYPYKKKKKTVLDVFGDLFE